MKKALINRAPLKRTEKFMKTTDDWCPSFKFENDPNDYVKISKFKSIDGKMWRVCAWGDDDLGMERDFKYMVEAEEVYNKIIKQDNVTFKYLKSLGLVPA